MLGWLFSLRKRGSPEPATSGARQARDAGPAAPISAALDAAIQLHHAGRHADAEVAYRELLAANPADVDALHFLGFLHFQRGQHVEAEQLILRALELYPSNVPAQINLGHVLQAQARPTEAIACYRRAAELAPGDAAIHVTLGIALASQGAISDAIASFRRALEIDPALPEPHNNLGNVLKDLGRLDEAVACFESALRLKPDFAEAHFNLGIVFRDQAKRDRAAACFERALALRPGLVEAHYGLGHLHADLDQREQALECFRRALSLDAGYIEARWSLAMCQLQAVPGLGDDPDRSRAAFAAELEALEKWADSASPDTVARAVGSQQPFALAYQEESNRELLARYGHLCVRMMARWQEHHPEVRSRARPPSGKLTVAVVSRYFHHHSVWNAIAKGWFQALDRDRFRLLAFCLGVSNDDETRFAKSRAAHFEQGARNFEHWVAAIAREAPDALVYPEVGMDPMTLRLASLRLAPVQIATWGHPETTGLPTMDYFLSAEDLEPCGAQDHYCEHLVALPHLGVYVEPARIEPVLPDLRTWDIDANAPLLLCPGTPIKYLPQYDWIFPEIARRLRNCRFVFFTHWTPGLSERLRRRLESAFRKMGLNAADHVTFIPWLSRQAFYGMMQRADVYLDTIGFSGFNTALQAMECSLPVVTREGRFMRGRLASGVLKRTGLRDLVTSSEAGYVALAVRLAQDRGFNQTIRLRIASGRAALFEDHAPIRALEAFLGQAVGKRHG